MRNFEEQEKSNENHHQGRIEIFNAELIAIAGETRKIEIIRNRQWKNMTTVGNRNGMLLSFSSLIVPGNTSDILFVFGINFVIISFNLKNSIRWKIKERGI